jgi:hypothetical protein
MKVYALTRSYHDMHGSNIVCICSEKIRAEKLMGMINRGAEDTGIYKIEEHEVME